VLRPLLGESRAELRHFAQTLKLPFVDDPSNADPRFDRARARAALTRIGIDAADIAATARRLARAREALAARARSVAERLANADDLGVLRFDRDAFAEVERDTQLRLLAAALQWVGGGEYRPRAAPLETLLDRALAGGGGTLHGAQVEVTRMHIEIFREYAALSGLEVQADSGTLWDGRWRIHAVGLAGMRVRALGDAGWTQLPAPRPEAPRHAIARTMPAVFDGERLVACPAAGFGSGVSAELCTPRGQFLAGLNAH
jgi:tRNA(Ile)-lysidine synthase